MNTIREIVDAAGGQHRAARAIGVPVTTLHAWVKKDRVPSWRADKLDELRRFAASVAPA